MGQYKLTYFDSPGRAAAIRMTFKLANQEFEDERITKEEWAKIKDNTPENMLPVLQTPEGKIINQSTAILRYLARKFDLYGKTDDEKYEVDWAFGTLNDLYFGAVSFMHIQDEEELGKKVKEYAEGKAGDILKRMNDRMKENGFLVNSGPTIGDLMLLTGYGYVWKYAPEMKEKYPALTKNIGALMESSPQLAEHLKTFNKK